jgi:hypothetical protein
MLPQMAEEHFDADTKDFEGSPIPLSLSVKTSA